MKTSEKIIRYIKENKQATVHELVEFLDISRMAVLKQVSNLLSDGSLIKIGKSPKVFYLIAEKSGRKNFS